MTDEEIKSILARYASGTCTREEKEWVDAWLAHTEARSGWGWQDGAQRQNTKQGIAQKIKNRIQNPLPIRSKRLKYLYRGIAASLVLIIAGMGYYVMNHQPEAVSTQQYVIASPKQAQGPTLTLADGTAIPLDQMVAGTEQKQKQTTIKKSGAHTLVYAYNTSATADEAEGRLNTLRISSGETYQLVLPDGSKVWLNACSELAFPNIFNKKQRKVFLKGEAFFEIAPRSEQPFVVETVGAQVQVLGTSFNISAYPDEDQLNTTLIAGAVAVSTEKERVLLKPNQQASISKNKHDISVKTVDPELMLAWKNGYFIFDDLAIKSIMHQISRWYNVSVVVDARVPNKKFGGTFSRSKPIADLLTYLEQLGGVHCQLEEPSARQKERRVIVMP